MEKELMALIKTVCEVEEPVLTPDPDNPKEMIESTEVVYYYLLHWGLAAGQLHDKDGDKFNAMWTVAICENMKTGEIRTFIPDVITIIGYERFNATTKPGLVSRSDEQRGVGQGDVHPGEAEGAEETPDN